MTRRKLGRKHGERHSFPEAVRRIVVKRGRIEEYVLQIIAGFNMYGGPIEIYAEGPSICLLCDVVASLKGRLDDSLEISDWDIGSRFVRGERRTYMALLLRYKP